MPNTIPIDRAILTSLEDGQPKTAGDLLDLTHAGTYAVLSEALRSLVQRGEVRSEFAEPGHLVYKKASAHQPPQPVLGLFPWRQQQQ